MWEKLKSFLGDERSFYGLLVIVVGLASFIFGRLSVGPTDHKEVERVKITQQKYDFVQESVASGVDATVSEVVVVASRSGSRYHRQDCPGAAQIKESNRVEFSSVAAARAAGYTPASNCPGLE